MPSHSCSRSPILRPQPRPNHPIFEPPYSIPPHRTAMPSARASRRSGSISATPSPTVIDSGEFSHWLHPRPSSFTDLLHFPVLTQWRNPRSLDSGKIPPPPSPPPFTSGPFRLDGRDSSCWSDEGEWRAGVGELRLAAMAALIHTAACDVIAGREATLWTHIPKPTPRWDRAVAAGRTVTAALRDSTLPGVASSRV